MRDNKAFTSLRDGILSGRINGQVGHISREGIRYAALESAIAHAGGVPTLTTRTSKLLAYSDLIVKARKAVKYNAVNDYEFIKLCFT